MTRRLIITYPLSLANALWGDFLGPNYGIRRLCLKSMFFLFSFLNFINLLTVFLDFKLGSFGGFLTPMTSQTSGKGQGRGVDCIDNDDE
jgi:hypothetical protein